MESLVRQAGAELIGAAVVVDGMSDRALRRTLGLRSILNVRELADLVRPSGARHLLPDKRPPASHFSERLRLPSNVVGMMQH